MPNSAIIAAALTDHSARAYSLFVDNVDVLGFGTGTLGVDLDTIQLDEVGPGGVSSIEFMIGDPSGTMTIQNGAVIRFHWNTPDVPLFLGWVDTYSVQPGFGGQGRWITVQGIGEESLLDFRIVIDPIGGGKAGGQFGAEVGYHAMLAGVPNYIWAGNGVQSSQAAPIGGYYRIAGEASGLSTPWFASFTGLSLRRAIESMFAEATKIDNVPSLSGGTQARVLFTMDFYGGLRVWNDYPGERPSDYTDLTVNDASAGPIVAENLQYAVDPTQIVHEVYVNGDSAASSGWFGDGTGIVGKQQYVDDPTNITSALIAYQSAQAVFQANNNQVRGSFELSDHTPVATIHAGSLVTITDAAVGLSAQQYRIMEIEKTFNASGRQNWRVSFGSLAPNVARFTRRLTYQIRGTN